MKNSQILLWLIAIVALVLSLLNFFGVRPSGLQSQAASPRYQVDTVETATDLGLLPDSVICARAYGEGWTAEFTSDGRTVCVKPTADGRGKVVKDFPLN